MDSLTDRVVATCREISEIPTLVKATLLPSDGESLIDISTKWKQSHLTLEEKVHFQKNYVLCQDSLLKKTSHLPVAISAEQLSVISPSGKLRAVLRKVFDKIKDNKQILEVWKETKLWKKFDLADIDRHGQVYTDDEFGSFMWSPCESKLLYIAEKKQPKSESFFKVKHPKKGSSHDEEDPVIKGGEYEYREDWGEQKEGKHQPVVVIVDVTMDTVSVLEQVPDDCSPGQVVWVPSGEGIVGIAWKNKPRRLGHIYCYNREGALFYATLDGQYLVLSEGKSYRSPRFSPDGQLLVWLETNAGGPHNKGHHLMKCTWQTKHIEVVVDIVQTEKSIDDGEFCGFYGTNLSTRCWCLDSKRILLSCPQEYTVCLSVVDVVTGTVKNILRTGSNILLDVKDDIVAVEHSTLTVPSHLLIAKLPEEGKEDTVKFVAVDGEPAVAGMEKLSWSVMKLHKGGKESLTGGVKYNALFIGPKEPPKSSESKMPLIALLHGGPHSVYTNSFNVFAAVFAKLGFACVMVNYTGSIGSGENSIKSLLGRIGTTDVQDCHHAVEEALHQHDFLDPHKVVLLGGSHGGFLVTHLIGQYPDFYKAASVRNPATNLAAMVSVTDIPDWSWVEAGLDYSFQKPPTPDVLKVMWEHSPIRYVDQVKTPLLMFIGQEDRRVPPSQGYDYYHALRARGVNVSLMTYEDCHPLQKVPVADDCMVKAALWYLRFLDH